MAWILKLALNRWLLNYIHEKNQLFLIAFKGNCFHGLFANALHFEFKLKLMGTELIEYDSFVVSTLNHYFFISTLIIYPSDYYVIFWHTEWYSSIPLCVFNSYRLVFNVTLRMINSRKNISSEHLLFY